MRLLRIIIGLLLIQATASDFAAEIPQSERRSGSTFMTPQTQAIQDDDTANPAMLSVLDGEKLWKEKSGTAKAACADCHGDPGSMRGVAAHYPAFDARLGRPVNLEQRINLSPAVQARPIDLSVAGR